MQFQKKCPYLTLGSLSSLVFWVGPALGQIPDGYYDSVDATNATTLRQTLHEVIDDHTRFPYTIGSPNTWDILEGADQDPSNSNNIIDLYRNTSIAKQGGGKRFLQPRTYLAQILRFPERQRSELSLHRLPCSVFLCNSSLQLFPAETSRFGPVVLTVRRNRRRQTMVKEVAPVSSLATPTGPPDPIAIQPALGKPGADGGGDVARALFYLDVRYEGGTHGSTSVAETRSDLDE